jgi:Cu-Zn family superoxide dismutase
VGKCDAPGFTTAGGHLNPDGHQHGAENPAGSHLGDLTNLTVGPDGTGALDFALRGGADMTGPALFDADGTALVIHAAPDDYKTDPAATAVRAWPAASSSASKHARVLIFKGIEEQG